MNDYFYSLELACYNAVNALNRAGRYSTANDTLVALLHLEDQDYQ